jgi:hypothetical protein
MEQEITVKDIVDLWPNRAALAADIDSEADPVTVAQINKWAQRGTIPSPYHARVLRAAEARGFAITAAQIVAAHDRVPSQTPSEDAA